MKIDFENLDLIPELLEQISLLRNEVKELKESEYDLTKRDGVKKYLGIPDSTIAVMMSDGRLRANKHYIKELKGKKPKITFIESAIRELKVS